MEINVSAAETGNDSAPRRPEQQQPPRGRVHINVAHSWKERKKKEEKSKTKALESPRMHIQKDE